ncbi:ran-specific gtpase-activating [Cystoisospora suis]|uniref:Ran-specific gtpase-activating n=1 Tax=Cystoisospora suis TaxID=483139 RepID=A0A2C6KPF0_9APIC|nr:ran-specific gtpase-activating [Cystoisospora suis]
MADVSAEPKPAEAPATAATKEDDENFNPEEEVTEGNWNTPQVEVREVKVETGEEEEEVFWKCRSKLYRWVSAGSDSKAGAAGEWKERGIGEAKLLRHKQTKKIRFLLRQEKTLKIVANHYVVATDVYCKLSPNVSSEKIWVWTVMDFAEGELKNEQFALKFGQVEQANEFKAKFEEAAKLNAEIFGIAADEKKDEKEAPKEEKEEKSQEGDK